MHPGRHRRPDAQAQVVRRRNGGRACSQRANTGLQPQLERGFPSLSPTKPWDTAATSGFSLPARQDFRLSSIRRPGTRAQASVHSSTRALGTPARARPAVGLGPRHGAQPPSRHMAAAGCTRATVASLRAGQAARWATTADGDTLPARPGTRIAPRSRPNGRAKCTATVRPGISRS